MTDMDGWTLHGSIPDGPVARCNIAAVYGRGTFAAPQELSAVVGGLLSQLVSCASLVSEKALWLKFSSFGM